jgi:L-fucose isomerase-like protein
MEQDMLTKKQDVSARKSESDSMRLGFICLARKAFDHAMARSMAEKARSRLLGLAGSLVVPQDWMIESLKQAAAAVKDFQTGHVDAVLVLCGTFASAELVLHIVERLGVPVIIWTVPEPDLGDYLHLNSLVGGNAVTSALYKLGYPYKFYYHSVDDERFYDALGRYLRVLGLARAIRTVRIGVFGGRPAGFQDIVFDELFLRRKVGFQLHTIELADLVARSNRVSEETAAALSRRWETEYSVAGPTSKELATMGRLYTALKDLAEENQLDVLAVRCLPEIWEQLGITPCAALSVMTDEGLPASCEADVLGAATMYIHRWLSGGGAPFISDLISIDAARNRGRLWHCGLAPACMAADRSKICLSRHYTRKTGVTMEFSLKAGPITLSRLDIAGQDVRMLIASGSVTGEEIKLKGSVADVAFKENVVSLLDTIVNQGFPHHFTMTYGDITEELKDLCRLMEIRVVTAGTA